MAAPKTILYTALSLLSFCFTAEAVAFTDVSPHMFTVLLKGTTPDSVTGSVTIPLKRAGRLFLIEAIIDGQDGNLIFDTGATGLVINRTYFRKYAAVSASTAHGGVSGSTGKTTSTVISNMRVSGLQFDNVSADMADLGHIEDRRGVKIIGLFGFEMLRDMEVIFDGPGSQLRLSRTDGDGNLLFPDPEPLKFACSGKLDTRHHIMMIEAVIAEKVLQFCLDTGAEINALHYALPGKVLKTVDIKRRSDLGGSGSGTIKALYGTMNEFTFECSAFGKMDAVIIDLTSMCDAYGCHIDGMLGFDFWQKGIFMFNLRKQVISYSLRKEDIK